MSRHCVLLSDNNNDFPTNTVFWEISSYRYTCTHAMHMYTLHTTHYTLHTTHYILHTTYYTLHTTHYTLHTTYYTHVHTTYYTLHTTHMYTLHTTHYILHTTYYTRVHFFTCYIVEKLPELDTEAPIKNVAITKHRAPRPSRTHRVTRPSQMITSSDIIDAPSSTILEEPSPATSPTPISPKRRSSKSPLIPGKSPAVSPTPG